jgi:hypothetical protein
MSRPMGLLSCSSSRAGQPFRASKQLQVGTSDCFRRPCRVVTGEALLWVDLGEDRTVVPFKVYDGVSGVLRSYALCSDPADPA